MKIYSKLESLGFFKWLSETHNLIDTNMKPEYLDELPLSDIHKTVGNSMAFRWFREKYGLCSWIERMYTADSICYYRYTCEYKKDPSSKTHEVILSIKEYNTYEEAELKCLKQLIKIVKKE